MWAEYKFEVNKVDNYTYAQLYLYLALNLAAGMKKNIYYFSMFNWKRWSMISNIWLFFLSQSSVVYFIYTL